MANKEHQTRDNTNLHNAMSAKKDEFYTQYEDIQNEMNEYDLSIFKDKTILLPCDDPEWSNFTKFFAANFERYGIKKLISTSYANDKKGSVLIKRTSFEENDEKFDEDKTDSHGKIFILERDKDNIKKVNINDLKWDYLEGDGDFRSEEVKKLRDEADIIITNPPFSLFREFLEWIMEANKKFLIIGNENTIATKYVFPLIKENKIWLGASIISGDREFRIPDDYPLDAARWRVNDKGEKFIRVKSVRWFTNLDHYARHKPILNLMTYEDNLKYSKHKTIRENGYPKYDNYGAIEVNYFDAVPSDYDGVMGVAVSFLTKHCAEQFDIVGMAAGNSRANNFNYDVDYVPMKEDRGGCCLLNGKRMYTRILIKRKG